MTYESAIVIGGGAFGTSMASVLSDNFKKVYVLVRSQDVYDSIKNGENSVYLPGQKLSINIIPALSWEEIFKENSIANIQLIVNGLPTSAIHSFYTKNKSQLESFFKLKIPLVSISKGIDPETLEMSDDLFQENFPHFQDYITYLSGPSFAKEIIDRQITIVALAGRLPDVLFDVCKKLGTDYFKCIPTYDIKGVLLSGALKNILAIAGGILEGLGFNHNTRAAMITRGINEMLRFGKVYNARPETFYSFAGMGDLILTTTSSLSRNKTFGVEVATSKLTPSEIIAAQRSVVEGYKTTQAAYSLAKKYKIKAPLFDGVYKILYEDTDPKDILSSLMKMPISTIE